jgi:hypothetical protein
MPTSMCYDIEERLKRSYHEHPDIFKNRGIWYSHIKVKDYTRVKAAEKLKERA